MHRLLRLGLGLLLALGLMSPALADEPDAEPDGESPATAIPLTNAYSDDFTGSLAGEFRYYTVDYGAKGRLGKITITTTPNDPGTAKAVGINLWKDGSLVATGHALGTSPLGPTPGTNSIAFSPPTAGPILVQVYNYAEDVDVSYHLSLAWPGQSAASAGDSTIKQAALKSGTLGGSLAGSRGGSFAYHELWSPGDASTQAVALTFAPGGPDVGSAVFMNLYQNGAMIATGKGSDAVSGVLTVRFGAAAEGPVQVQVVNQNEGKAISYSLSQSQVPIVEPSEDDEGGDEGGDDGGPDE